MHIMYVDDSGAPEITDTTKYFVASGIIFHSDFIDGMKNAILTFKNTNFIGSLQNAEIHAYEMYRGGGCFRGVRFPQRMQLLSNLYNTINSLDSTIIAIAIDKQKFADRHSDPNEILEYGYKLLVERYDNFLIENDSKGILRIDQSTKAGEPELNEQDSTILRTINKVRKRGTNWQLPAVNIIDDPVFHPSHESRGLQTADAVAYCVNRHINQKNNFQNFWSIIESKLRKRNGTYLGYGFRIYPR